MEVRPGPGYYEVCLAVIETSTVYYLHQSLCTEVEVLSEEEEEEEVVEVVVRPGVETARVGWTGVNTTERVRLTVREWGQPLPVISRLVYHNSSSLASLQPDTAYTVCVEPAEWRVGATKHCQEVNISHQPADCRLDQLDPPQFKTQTAAWLTRETAVATSAAVSSSSTMVVIFLLWCCCSRRKKVPADKADCRRLDVNENESCQVKHEAGCGLGGGGGPGANTSRMWHQKCSSGQPLTHTRWVTGEYHSTHRSGSHHRHLQSAKARLRSHNSGFERLSFWGSLS